MSDNQAMKAGGFLKRGLHRLTKILERKIDHQIMTAQIRAQNYHSSSEEKPQHV
ncbi:hypothetical protein ACEQ8H_004990 [Pleosporales sp. CAS-2024a]